MSADGDKNLDNGDHDDGDDDDDDHDDDDDDGDPDKVISAGEGADDCYLYQLADFK